MQDIITIDTDALTNATGGTARPIPPPDPTAGPTRPFPDPGPNPGTAEPSPFSRGYPPIEAGPIGAWLPKTS